MRAPTTIRRGRSLATRICLAGVVAGAASAATWPGAAAAAPPPCGGVPQITDAAGDGHHANTDVVAAWLAESSGRVQAVIQPRVAVWEPAHDDSEAAGFALLYELAGQVRYVRAEALRSAPVRFDHGTWTRSGGFARTGATTGAAVAGAGGTVTIDVPGVLPGTVLARPFVLTYDGGGAEPHWVDRAPGGVLPESIEHGADFVAGSCSGPGGGPGGPGPGGGAITAVQLQAPRRLVGGGTAMVEGRVVPARAGVDVVLTATARRARVRRATTQADGTFSRLLPIAETTARARGRRRHRLADPHDRRALHRPDPDPAGARRRRRRPRAGSPAPARPRAALARQRRPARRSNIRKPRPLPHPARQSPPRPLPGGLRPFPPARRAVHLEHRSHPMTSTRIAGALAVAAALALPAAAAAHPSVYTDATARVLADPNDPNSLVPQTRHVVTNHGFTFVLRETNGLGAPKGVITFSRLPGAYRATKDFDVWQAEGGTGAQPHTTCQVAALEEDDAIKAWQDEDPFYNYVPFQKASAGLQDDPARWIPVVQNLTGVNLATVADPAAACAGLGGVYTPADQMQTTTASLNSGFLEQETAPLTDEIADLKTEVSEAGRATAAVQALLDAARAQIARLTAAATPMQVTLPSATLAAGRLRRSGTTAAVSGQAGARVAVTLTVGERRARKMKLPTSTLARGSVVLGAGGTADVALKPRKRVARRLARMSRSIAITATARTADRIASTTATLTR